MLGQALSPMPPTRQRDELPHVQVAGVSFKLALLKGFELTRDGVDVRVPSGAQHLLAFLALSNRAIGRSRIGGTLWNDVPEERAAGNLRSVLWRLRQIGFDLIGASGDHLSLAPTVVVDIYEVARIARLVADPSANIATLNLDDMPLAGELLPGWDDDWVLLERERQRQIVLHVLDTLCERWTLERRYAEAVRAGLAAVASEPLRESSQCALIRAFLAEGNPTEAIRRFNIYQLVLRKELNLEPSPRITELVASCGIGNGLVTRSVQPHSDGAEEANGRTGDQHVRRTRGQSALVRAHRLL
jgi:DNA-binding SARP family transcriptional activator